jgi:hypothetical protein
MSCDTGDVGVMSVQAKDTKAASIHQELGEESTFSLEPPGGPNPEL